MKCGIAFCNIPVQGTNTCSIRHGFLNDKKAEAVKGTPIKKVSDNRKELNKEYYKDAKLFIKENPLCQLQMNGCTKKAQHVHHVKGRIGKLLMEKKYWKASCDHCNLQAEVRDQEAREAGHKLSKHEPNYKRVK